MNTHQGPHISHMVALGSCDNARHFQGGAAAQWGQEAQLSRCLGKKWLTFFSACDTHPSKPLVWLEVWFAASVGCGHRLRSEALSCIAKEKVRGISRDRQRPQDNDRQRLKILGK